MRNIELQEFVDEIYEDSIQNHDSKYIFFLGAGCSKSSGIPLASELAKKWYNDLNKQVAKFKKFNDKNKITKLKDYSFFYFKIFEALFPDSLSQQKEIQRLTEDRIPSLGYYVLSTLMQNPSFNSVITTNFDDLMQDALIYTGQKRALVITHHDLAKFIARNNTPLIIKCHGDAHMHPFNNTYDTKKISKELSSAIHGILNNAKIIFIGYNGNDSSIEKLLTNSSRISQVYWINNKIPKNVSITNWWNNLETKTWVKEFDFDKIMLLIKDKFKLSEPNFHGRAKVLTRSYDCAITNEINILERKKNKSYVDYMILGNNYFTKKKYKKAIKSYNKAIKIKPKYANAYFNIGAVYQKLNEHLLSRKYFLKAKKLNKRDSGVYNNIGITYWNEEKYLKAIKYFKKAIYYNNNSVMAYSNLGNAYFYSGNHIKAINSYNKALEINPEYYIAYLNLFELNLIKNYSFNFILEISFKRYFRKNKEVIAKYDMLKTLQAINQSKKANTKKWIEKYHDCELVNWDYTALTKWVNTIENKALKQRLIKALKVFKKRTNSTI